MGLSRPAECTNVPVVAYSVCDSRLAVLTTSRSSGTGRVGTEVPTPPMDLDPLQGTPGNPSRSLPTPATLLRFTAPTATSARRSTHPGFHTRFVPPSGFRTLLTVSSLRRLPVRGPEPLMGFTLQSFSPSRSRTPFGAVALLPFLTSRSSALRTKRSRCPATSGLSSPRGSVSSPAPEGGGGTDTLLGLSPLQSVPRTPWNRLPGSFLPALCSPALRKNGRPALQGLAERAGRKRPCGRIRLS